MTRWEVSRGDCIEVLKGMDDCSVDAVVTDPPAGVSFMSKDWDHDLGGMEPWVAWLASAMAECLRVVKPGGHAFVWALPRTSHWTGLALERAGWEVRDCVVHMFGSGFPKSLDVSKAIDKRPGVASHREFAAHLAERREAVGLARADVSEKVVGTRTGACWNWEHHQFPEAKWWPALRDLLGLDDERWGPIIAEAEREKIGDGQGAGSRGNTFPLAPDYDITAPATPEAERWQGWGTALKPAMEMWWLARKPLSGTVAQTVAEHGTGALNVAACRINTEGPRPGEPSYTPGASRGTPRWPDAPAALQASLLDALRRTASELRSCSSGGTSPSPNGGDLDGTSPSGAGYAESPPGPRPSGSWCGWTASAVLDSPVGCPSCRRSCDALLRAVQEVAQGPAPSLAGALDGIAQALPGLGCIHGSPGSDLPSTCGALDLIASAVDSFPCDTVYSAPPTGRWPANVVLDSEAARLLDEQTGELTSGKMLASTERGGRSMYGQGNGRPTDFDTYGDSGGASRFFYVAKASRVERNAGLQGFEEKRSGTGALRAEQGGEYMDFLHPAPAGVGAWLREQREAAGLPVKAVAAHFPSRTGGLTGCVSNWECEYNRPTPDQWVTLRKVIGFDDRYDEVMTEQRAVPHAVRSCTCDTFTEWVNEGQPEATPAGQDTPRPRDITASGTPTSSGSDSLTTSSGSRPTELSQTGSKSTTATRTSRTIGSTTSNSSPPSSTSESTPPTSVELATDGSAAAPSAGSGSPPPPSTTTSADRAGSSTADADPATSGSSSELSSSARKCPSCGGVVEGERVASKRNVHPLEPTVKPIELMRWLVRLVTPPGGTVVDPFTGSGTTGCAAVLEGFDFIGIEREDEYADIAEARIRWWEKHKGDGLAAQVLAAGEAREAVEATGQASFFDEDAA